MSGALLRSGTLHAFKPLGVDGQPVHASALQLREAIRLRIGREAADCLAIPQPHEAGDTIDWYAPRAGDVIPWSAAVEEERTQAYQHLERLHQQLLEASSRMRGDESGEKQIFARLLEKAIHFPDRDHVYLVDGKPVVTFWGFTDQSGRYLHDPLLCLRPEPAPAPVAAAIAPLAPQAPAAVAPPPPVAQAAVAPPRRWRWLWWLLLIPLLLLLLLLLLRGCAPQVKLPLGLSEPDIAGFEWPAWLGGTLPEVALDGALPAGPGADGEAAIEAPAEPSPLVEEPPVQEPTTDATEQPEDSSAGQAEPPAAEDVAEQPVQEPAAPVEPGAAQAGKPLEIPATALDSGKTDFLNGAWKAGAGIQDARTGRPVQLDYNFRDGKGQVKVRGRNGVECTGDVQAAMRSGQLAISGQGQALCNDGSRYQLPEILCAPDAQGSADCNGNYGEQRFPLSMKQAQE